MDAVELFFGSSASISAITVWKRTFSQFSYKVEVASLLRQQRTWVSARYQRGLRSGRNHLTAQQCGIIPVPVVERQHKPDVVLGAQLQEAFPRRAEECSRTLAFVAVRQQHGQTTQAAATCARHW